MSETVRDGSALWMGGAGADFRTSAIPPLTLVGGNGIHLYDSDGNEYIDAIASLETSAIGHGRGEVARAVAAQLERLDFYDTLRHVSDVTVELADRLAGLFPSPLNHVHFATSGSEAVEAAVKLVRQYHVIRGHAEKSKVLSRAGAYHGCTFGAMALDGAYYRTRTSMFAPLPGQAAPVARPGSAEAFEAAILAEGPDTVAAIVVDPMATASGVHPPPSAFWSQLRGIGDTYDVVIVADEAICGFGRTGEWFASTNDPLGVPDVVTVSKGLTSGYMPMSATVVSDRIAEPFTGGDGRVFYHGHTFSGHPAAAAAALCNIGIIEDEGLVANARETGAYLASQLAEAAGGAEFAGEVRGSGLLFGIDVLAGNGRSPVEAARQVVVEMRRRGALAFLLHPGDVLFICPPLVITRSECDRLSDIVSDSLSSL